MSGYTGTTPIRLVVSDVDGTLVRHDKTLHPETIKAAQELRAAGITLCLASSRPPRGMEMYLEPLGITTPHAGFNGGQIVAADNTTILDNLVIPEDAADAGGGAYDGGRARRLGLRRQRLVREGRQRPLRRS